MEQHPSHVEAYLRGKTFSEDYDEAVAINYHFDILRDEVQMDASPSLLLEAATQRAYETLGDRSSIPGAHEFGYENAAYAWRWFNFRGAYLKDLQNVFKELDATNNPHQHGLSEEYGSYAEKMSFMQDQQRGAAEQLMRQNPVTFETFADLELERVRCTINPDAMMVDPFALEEEYSLRALCRVLDRVTNHPDALRIENTTSFKLHSEDALRPHSISIIKHQYQNGRAEYTIEETEAIPEHVSDTETTVPLTSYRIDCRPHAVRLRSRFSGEAAVADTFDLLDLAHKLLVASRS